MRQPLRISIILDSFTIPQWQYAMIERLLQADYVDIVAVVLAKQPTQPAPTLPFFFSLYQQIDRFLFARSCRPDALALNNATTLLADIPLIDLSTEALISALTAYQVDTIINCSSTLQASQTLVKLATYGYWSLSVVEPSNTRQLPPGYDEVFQHAPATETALFMEFVEGGSIQRRALYRSWSSTHPLSPYVNRNHLLWRSSLFIPRALNQLYRLGKTAFLTYIEQYIDQSTKAKSFAPSSAQALLLLINQFYKIGQKAFLRLFYRDQWFLLYRFQHEELADNFPEFTQLLPPKGIQFWADPHVIYAGGKHYIFLEELPIGSDKAHISVLTIDRSGHYSQPTRVLERPYHLSYPFVFSHEGQYYMIPETMDNGTIELYRCTHFPEQWEFVMNLMEGVRAVDTTLFFHENKWWLFTTLTEAGNLKPWDELFIFYANDFLTQQWTPHPLNPVVSDVRSARPAGKIFRHKKYAYRPSQNCSVRYGYGLKINQITELSETNYQEQHVVSVEPLWQDDIDGIHSYSHDQGLTVADGFWWRRKF